MAIHAENLNHSFYKECLINGLKEEIQRICQNETFDDLVSNHLDGTRSKDTPYFPNEKTSIHHPQSTFVS